MEMPAPHQTESLTARERDILRLMPQGLSNREIAAALFLSLGTIKWYNKQIYSKLGVNSREQAVRRAKDWGWLESDESDDPPTPPTPLKKNLPLQPTALIGRQLEIAEVTQLLQSNRLLTLTGPGGIGKTRLSLAVATDMALRYPDGVYFVDLAPLTDPSFVPGVIANALGVLEGGDEPLPETLQRALGTRKALLIIDNFEHVIEGAAIVLDLMAAPNLTLLVTSREALRVSAEQVYEVPPLRLPDDQQATELDGLAEIEAVSLFMQRARSVMPDFDLNQENAQEVIEICRHLDGLPLAIELAAARSRLLPPQAILQRMDERFRTLTAGARDAPARQKTLRATIDWSYDLLEEEEQTLFARLAVFHGGRSLEAIEAVCSDGLSIDVLDGLASLLDKSMIRQIEDEFGEPRFVMLETIQEYALERLTESGEAEATHRRHAGYFAEFAEQGEDNIWLGDDVYGFKKLDIEHDNLRAALGWSLHGRETEFGLRMVAAMRDFWVYEGYHVEARSWVEQAFALLEDAPQNLRGRLYLVATLLAFHGRVSQYLLEYGREALSIFREIGDTYNVAWSLNYVGLGLRGQPEKLDEAIAMCQEGARLFRMLGRDAESAYALQHVGNLLRQTGDFERAQHAYQESLSLCPDRRRKLFEIIALDNLGALAFAQGDFDGAEVLRRTALSSAWNLELRFRLTFLLVSFGATLAAKGHLERAVRVLGASAEAQKLMGAKLQPTYRSDEERYLDALPDQLDEATFTAAWQAGRKMSLEEAVEYVLEILE